MISAFKVNNISNQIEKSMKFTELLLLPFQRFFKPPVLHTPLSTIQWPNIIFSTCLLFVSFLVISGGVVFCYVNGMPMIGYHRDQSGQIVSSWIDPNGLSSQYLAEGIIASLMFSLGAASFMAAFFVMTKKGKPTEIDRLLNIFACSAPVWPIMSLFVFKQKIPSYFPAFSLGR
ncbi:hypothetical protein TRFO_39737 [Tritrichomonas foetus]|uniref:Uncharacterized protein n=1 Tax=Tritrichomonas foetus TaxID=1144522 RepID=A0A1J4J3R7_9EUKA|nr:hypothetical protein TRFO_39737 [Tritrichomonas foetus]|eukprot:OHS94070.1 hypothetical protein TRFO_39737 [Tritrichomonas foetus]